MADQPMQELLTCSICLDRFTNPKALPCMHTFCLNCLRRIAGNATKLNCPTCREEHQIPDDKVDNLKDNIVINNLLAMLEAGDGIHVQAQPKTGKECSDCKRKISLSKCRHCSEMICGDCRACHVELACDIKHFLNMAEHNNAASTAVDGPSEGDGMWQTLLDRIITEQERLPLLFEQLQKKITQRKEEITLYLDLMRKRLEHLLRKEETPLERSVQQRITECKTSSALRGFKYHLENTEATLASVLESEGKDKFEFLLESGVETMGHIAHGGQKIEIVGSGGPTSPIPAKPDRKPPVRVKSGEVGYKAKNTQLRKYVYLHPIARGVLKPLFALYSEFTDSIYCISEGDVPGQGQILVYDMTSDSASVLSPSVQSARHFALTSSGKIVIAEPSSVAVVDLSDKSSLCRIGLPDIAYPSQICAHGNELFILDPDKKRIFVYGENFELIREIEIKAKIDRNSKMAVNKDFICVTSSDITVMDKKDCGEEMGCTRCDRGEKKATSVKVRMKLPIVVYYHYFGQTIDTILLDTSAVFDYAYDTRCGGYHCIGDLRTDASANNDALIRKFRVQGFHLDSEGHLLITTTADRGHRVSVFTPEDEPHCEIGAPDSDQMAFNNPRGVALMPDGRLIVCDYGKRRIQLI